MGAERDNQSSHLALLALLAAYAAIHLLLLNNKPFFGDEIWFARLARGIMESGFPKPDMIVHPPAFGYMLAASFRLFGFSEASARLVPMLFGLLSLVVVYKLGSFISKSGGAGLLAVFILVISKIFNSYTTLVDMDGSAIAFFLLLETYLVLKYLDGGKMWPASLALGAGLLFKLGTIIVPFVVLLAIMDGEKRRALAGLLLGLLAFAAAYVFYFADYYPFGLRAGLLPLIHLFSSATAVREPLLKFLGVFLWNSSFPLVALLGYSLARAISDKDRKLRFLAWCALLIIAAYSLTSHKMERYFVPAVPMAAVLATDYLFPLIKRDIRLAITAAVAGFLYFGLLGTYSLSPANVALSVLPLALIAALIAYKNDVRVLINWPWGPTKWGSGAPLRVGLGVGGPKRPIRLGAERDNQSSHVEKFLVAAFGLYVGLSVFTASVYATHDYVINECEGQREAADYIKAGVDGGRAFVDATIGFYLDRDYATPPDLEAGIRDGTIKYYARCKAWPNLSKKNALDDIAERHESGSFHIKSIKISEFG